MRDIVNLITPVVAIAPTVITDNTALVGNIIDTNGYEGVAFLFNLGVLAATSATFAVTAEHGDAADLSDAVAVPNSNLPGTLALASFDQSAKNKTRKLGYTGAKRYVRIRVTPAGNNAAAPISAMALLAYPRFRPTANPPA
ncbi:hypothetical protein [Sphingomonas sp. BAUL-RG-20F-R05-02]|uniref:hypothetical protein n=1 Tax=Sphingomonas sp. BAUL-RG-20F-R05-02 TaxID=2914830 RepID=UPI001F5AB8DB|nr:hypothetical protein [Sphingomonas sp. BAUL-RG-20F-R05-02]